MNQSVQDLPSVTVIVLNYNGLKHLQSCFTSLLRLDYPQDRLELMLVDNASSDGSVEYVRREYPQVKIVQNTENLGFAAGNNVGARVASGQYVVFLNNDMWVDSQFIHGLIKAIRSDPEVVCAGAKILNWDGTRYDFAGGAAHFSGNAFQLGLNEAVQPERYAEIVPILFACGGAMIIDRQLFLQIGGFDEDYFIYFEDVDLCWRLWVLGHKVVFAPDALVYHRHHGTMNSFADYRKQVLYKRNSLYTIIKNYGDENLGRILPAVLLGTVNGLVEQMVQNGRLVTEEFYIKSAHPYTVTPIPLERFQASTLVAIRDVVRKLPQMMEKRRFVQSRRRRTDEEIIPLFRQPFRFWPDVDAWTQFTVVNAFDVDRLFADQPRRVLVISSDILPLPGLPTVGSGLRAWGLGQGLCSRGHQVLFSMPRDALAGREQLVPPEVHALAWTADTLSTIVRVADPDVVVVCNWPIMDALAIEGLKTPFVLDQHGPHLIEREHQRFGNAEDNARRKINAMRKADFFTCAGTKQMVYFQSWLERAGWSEEERQKHTAVIPVSLSAELPEHKPNGELTFVFGGVFLPWQDPSDGLIELVNALERNARGKLEIYGGKHPFIPIDTGVFGSLIEKLATSPRVVFQGMVSHDELMRRYQQAHVAIDVMRRNPERELAFTTRTVEYLWCGLPVIYHNYAELSDYIREYDAGWVVDPEDRVALAAVFDDIIQHPEQIAEKSKNAQRLARECFDWNKTIEPLHQFIVRPVVRVKEQAVSPRDKTVQQTRTLWEKAKYRYRIEGLLSVIKRGVILFSRWVYIRMKTRLAG